MFRRLILVCIVTLMIFNEVQAVTCPTLDCSATLTDNKCYTHTGGDNDALVMKIQACANSTEPLCYWDPSFMEWYDLTTAPDYNSNKILETFCAEADAFDINLLPGRTCSEGR